MTTILAFDIATRTGVAFGPVGGTPRSTAIVLGAKLPDAQRFGEMIKAAKRLITHLKPDILVYEAPVGGPKTSHFLVGIAACFAGESVALGYNPISLPLASVRKHFIGKHLTSAHFPGMTKNRARVEIKNTVIARCYALGWHVDGDDEADACALWDYAGATLGRAQSAPPGGLFNGQ